MNKYFTSILGEIRYLVETLHATALQVRMLEGEITCCVETRHALSLQVRMFGLIYFDMIDGGIQIICTCHFLSIINFAPNAKFPHRNIYQ